MILKRQSSGMVVPDATLAEANWWYLLVAVAAAAMGVWGYQEFIAPNMVPGIDESMYYLSGAQIWQDITKHDFHAFMRDTYRQQYVPFMGSYMQAAVMLVRGPSLQSASLASLLAGVFALVCLCWLSAALAEKQRALAAGMTAAIWSGSPMNVLSSGHNLLDSYALLASALCLLSAVKFVEAGKRRWAMTMGGAAALAFLTKYHVGIFLIASLLLGVVLPKLIEAVRRDWRAVFANAFHPWVVVAASCIVPIALFLSLGGLRMVAAYLRGQPFPPMSLQEHLFYYPTIIWEVFFSIRLLVLIPLGGLLYWVVRCWSEPRAKAATFFVLLTFTSALLHVVKDGRVLHGSMGVLLALSAAAMARWVARLRPGLQITAHLMILALCVAALWNAPAAIHAYNIRNMPGVTIERQAVVRQALDFFRRNVDQTRPLVFLGSSDGGPSALQVQAWIWEPRRHSLPQFEQLPYPGFPEYKGWGFSTEDSPLYEENLRSFLNAHPNAELLLARYEANSPLKGGMYPYMMAWQENYVRALDRMENWSVTSKEKLPFGLEVSIYKNSKYGSAGTLGKESTSR